MNLTTKILGTCKFIFVLFLIYFAFRLFLYHFYLITFPYPDMLRDGAIMTSTQALVNGLNPYSMDLQPQYTNAYGIMYPLVVWPLAKIFGITMLIHRAVTAFFIFAVCALIFFVLKKLKVPALLNLWAVIMLYASLLYPGTSTPCIDSGAMGMFLLLLTIFIPWFARYTYLSLAASVLCGILAFYTKPYTMLGIAVMATYVFIFISKTRGFLYSLFFLVLAAVSVPIVNAIFPAYFDNCVFMSANMTASWSTMERLHMQIHMYTGLHEWILILAGIMIAGYAFHVFRNFKRFKKPLIKAKFPLVLYAGAWSAMVLYISLGRHNGATLWYFFQLFSPFFLVSLAWLFSRHSFWPVICAPVLIFNLYVMTVGEDYTLFNKDSPGWPQVTELIREHQHVLNSSLITPLLIEQNKEFFDNGMSEYFGSGGQRGSWMKLFSKEDDIRVSIQLAMFFGRIRSMVQNKEFDLIILQPSLLPLGVGDDIRKYYKYEGELDLYAPQDHRSYDMSFWKPI